MNKLTFLTVLLLSALTFASTEERVLQQIETVKSTESECLASSMGQSTVGAEDCVYQSKLVLDKLADDLLSNLEDSIAQKELNNYTSRYIDNTQKKIVFVYLLIEKREKAVELTKANWEGGTGQGRAAFETHNRFTIEIILKMI